MAQASGLLLIHCCSILDLDNFILYNIMFIPYVYSTSYLFNYFVYISLLFFGIVCPLAAVANKFLHFCGTIEEY